MLAGAAKRNKESISFAENCITEHNAEGHEFPLRKYTYFCPKTVKKSFTVIPSSFSANIIQIA